jgi:hypothetical protein
MRWLFLFVGGVATAAMLLISMRLNFLFGYSLGQTPEKAWVFGCVSVISDAWKGLGPIFILSLLRMRRWPSALGAATIWIACVFYSVTSAVGVAVEDRSSRTGSRETLSMNYGETTAEIERLEKRRKGLREHRSAPELEAAITALLIRPVEDYQRVRGTVGSLSNNCQRADLRTLEACSQIAQLREELAAANAERDLDSRLSELSSQTRQLRERGAARTADPQAELLARLSRGWLSPGDIGPGLSLLLAVTIELVSAFGPAVLSTYAEATETPARDRRTKGIGRVIDYLAERVEPARGSEMLSESDLYADYCAWCCVTHRTASPAPEFVAALDQLRRENGLGKIRKRKDCYAGIRLVPS